MTSRDKERERERGQFIIFWAKQWIPVIWSKNEKEWRLGDFIDTLDLLGYISICNKLIIEFICNPIPKYISEPFNS